MEATEDAPRRRFAAARAEHGSLDRTPLLRQKGLIVNSRHLCHKPGRNRAKSNIRGQNGKFSRTRPRVVATTCQKRRKAKRNKNKRRKANRSSHQRQSHR